MRGANIGRRGTTADHKKQPRVVRKRPSNHGRDPRTWSGEAKLNSRPPTADTAVRSRLSRCCCKAAENRVTLSGKNTTPETSIPAKTEIAGISTWFRGYFVVRTGRGDRRDERGLVSVMVAQMSFKTSSDALNKFAVGVQAAIQTHANTTEIAKLSQTT